MKPVSLPRFRRVFLFLMIIAMPALACNTLSKAEEKVSENAAELVGDIVDKVGEQVVEGQSDSSSTSDSTIGNSSDNQSSDSGKDDKTSSAEVGSDESPDAISAALSSSLTQDSMRIRILSEDITNDQVTNVTLAFVRPDQYEMTADDVEIIVIGDTSWIRTPGQDWVETPTSMSSTVEEALQAYASSSAIQARLDDVSSDMSGVKSLGTETIDGIETRGYEIEQDSGDDFYSLVRMWIGVNDGLLYRQEIRGTVGDYENHTLMEFEYGDAVIIERPN
jgi:hypothetical protein